MILIRPRAAIVVTLAILIFTATSSVLSGIYSAPSAFAGGDYFVISETSAPTIFSSRVDTEMIDALAAMDNITSASGEVFAFSSYLGISFVVRGMGEGFGNEISPVSEEISWAPGITSPADGLPRSWAIVGVSLMERLGIQPPAMIPLVGSYSPRVELAYVAGYFDTRTSLDDELIVTNEVARYLSGTPNDAVSIIRVVTTEPEWLDALLSPRNARFALSDLRISKVEIAIGETVSVSVDVRNWGGSFGAAEVLLSEGSTSLASFEVSLGASSSTTLSAVIEFDQLGDHALIASVSGGFPVRLYANITVIEPYLVVSAPARVALGSTFTVSVTDYTGLPSIGSSATFQNQTVNADTSGRVNFTAVQAGSHVVIASSMGYINGTRTISVLDPAEYPDAFNPAIVSFALQPTTISESEAATGIVVVENNGIVAGSFVVVVYVDSLPGLSMTVDLQGMSSATRIFRIDSLSAGEHVVQVGDFSYRLQVVAWYADDSDLLQLILRYGGSSSLSAANSLPIYQAAKISEGNVVAALFSIGGVSALLAALAVTSIFTKELREHRRAIGILRTIGASRNDLRRFVLPQALAYGLLGSAVGVVLGALLTYLLSSSAALMVFGHQFAVEMNLELLTVVFVSSVAIGIISAVWATDSAARTPPMVSIRDVETEST